MATRVGFRDLVGQATNNQLPDILTSQDPVDPTDVVNLQYFEANYARYYIQSQTAFTDVQGETEFTPDGFEFIENRGDVYYNGVQLLQGINYTVASGSITLTTPVAAADDWVVLRTYQSTELESFAPMRVVDTLPDPEDVPDGTVVLLDADQTLAFEQDNGNAVFRMVDETGAEVGQVWTGDNPEGAPDSKLMYMRVRFADGSTGLPVSLNSSGAMHWAHNVGSTENAAVSVQRINPSPYSVFGRTGAISAGCLNDITGPQYYAIMSITSEQQGGPLDQWRLGANTAGSDEGPRSSRFAVVHNTSAGSPLSWEFLADNDDAPPGSMRITGDYLQHTGVEGEDVNLSQEIRELKAELAALKEAMNV